MLITNEKQVPLDVLATQSVQASFYFDLRKKKTTIFVILEWHFFYILLTKKRNLFFQELGDQLNKAKAEKEKALKSLKTLKVNHDVSYG